MGVTVNLHAKGFLPIPCLLCLCLPELAEWALSADTDDDSASQKSFQTVATSWHALGIKYFHGPDVHNVHGRIKNVWSLQTGFCGRCRNVGDTNQIADLSTIVFTFCIDHIDHMISTFQTRMRTDLKVTSKWHNHIQPFLTDHCHRTTVQTLYCDISS